MPTHSSPLDYVKVAAPCAADWEKMVGDERVRFCSQCNLNVYNLSGMTRREAETLVTNTEGRLCVRFYRRGDGTILTDNCPEGLRALRRRARRVATSAASALFGFIAGLGLNFGLASRPAKPVSAPLTNTTSRPPFQELYEGQMVMTPLPVIQPQSVERPTLAMGIVAVRPVPNSQLTVEKPRHK